MLWLSQIHLVAAGSFILMIEKIIVSVLTKIGKHLFKQLLTFLQDKLQEYFADKLKKKIEENVVTLKKPETRLEGNAQNEDVLGSFN